ncbi:hypothetical protein GNI_173580 [Gregarina niphandrodes]|uniref:Uncharacterized protein n=1 Tax=Gregarina niphandrodes TaxID=110365 RepID=A0A023AYQ5_GRENI|nr:hypothetical protein GNI_173580 [Gregarina niphandrodes]EZG43400.1 hypothetical protein GNI_173580 [Gregarina niphandrodes]|eukprot:XP_011133369.1 hypothetical protein GNI_173580 [Gregarina niphandrodes]
MSEAEERVCADARAKGVETFEIPIDIIWKPWKWTHMSKPIVEEMLQSQNRRGCFIPLHDLLKTYRLTAAQCDSLERQFRKHLAIIDKHSPRGENCCVGSYAQVCVTLDRDVMPFPVSGNKLRVALAPTCMKASSKEEAREITDEFVNRLRADADYPAASRNNVLALAMNLFH